MTWTKWSLIPGLLLQATRKVAKCGYLFVAPGWDFSNPLNRTKVSTLLFLIACTCTSLKHRRHGGLAVYRENSLWSAQWLGYRLDDPGFGFQQCQDSFLFSKTSRSAPGPNQPLLQWLLEFYSGIKSPGPEVDQSPPSNAEVKNE